MDTADLNTQISIHTIEAVVTKEIPKGFQIKVSVLDLGLYLFGLRLTLNSKEKGWWLQTPAIPLKGRYWHNVEFDQAMTLWQEIEAKCHEARKEYLGSDFSDEELTDASISKSLDEPFNLDDLQI